MVVNQRRLDWDDRHKDGDFEGRGPNPTLVAGVAGLRPGRALELACGSGTNAVWLAGQGWQTTAVDWSPVGLANGQREGRGVRRRGRLAGARLVRVVASRAGIRPGRHGLSAPAARGARTGLRPCCCGRGSGGRLLIVGHDRRNATEGEGGPDPSRLFSADEIGRELLAADAGLVVERAEVVRRVPPPGRAPIDSLIVVRRPPARKESSQ